MKESMEQIYDEHLKNEPKKYEVFYADIDMGIEMKEHIQWGIEKENIELVKSIPKDKRIKALDLLKKGKTCGEVARELEIKDSLAVFYLIKYNLKDLYILREVSL